MNTIKLSEQQYKCLYFLSHGMTYKEIAIEMNISPRTVECYINLIRRKSNIQAKSRLVSFFLKQNYPWLSSLQETKKSV